MTRGTARARKTFPIDNDNGRRNVTGTPIFTKSFVILLISNIFFFGGFHITLPTTPLFALNLGGSDLDAGLTAGVFFAAAIAARLFVDLAVRRFGKRASLLLGVGLCCLACPLYTLCSSVGALLVVRALHGVGFGLGTTFYVAIAISLIPSTRRAEGLGYFGLATALAMAVAPATGLWLVRAYGFPTLYIAAAAMSLIAFLWFASGAVTIAQDPPRMAGAKPPPLVGRLIEKGTLLYATLLFLFGVGNGGLVNLLAVYARGIGVSHPEYFFLLSTLCLLFSRLFAGRIHDRKGAAWILIPGGTIFLIGLVLTACARGPDLLMVAAIFYGFGVGALLPALQTEILSAVEPDRRSGASATYSNAIDIGLGAGSVLLAAFAGIAGFPAAYLLAALCMVLFLALCAAQLLRQRQAKAE